MQTLTSLARRRRTVETSATLKTNASRTTTTISRSRLTATLRLKRSMPMAIPMQPSKVHARLAVAAEDVVLVAASHKAPMKTTMLKVRTSRTRTIKPKTAKAPMAINKEATKNARRRHQTTTLAIRLRTTRRATSLSSAQTLQATTLSRATTQVIDPNVRIQIPATVNVSREVDAVLRMDNNPHRRTNRPINPQAMVLQSLQARTTKARSLKTVVVLLHRSKQAVNRLPVRRTRCGRRTVQALLARDLDVTINLLTSKVPG